MQQNRLIKTQSCGIFVGKLSDNTFHTHYALQLTVALTQPFTLYVQDEKIVTDSIAIKPNISHQLVCHVGILVIILINPASIEGQFLNKHFLIKEYEVFTNQLTQNIKTTAIEMLQGKINNQQFTAAFEIAMQSFIGQCRQPKHQADERIGKALNYLYEHSQRVVSLEEISEKVHLSTSRFLHLFKEETDISYRRMQLWIKIMKAIDLLGLVPSLTEIAHTCGFADSAHFSRTFKSTFGIKPSVLFQNSQFVQALP